MRKFTSLFLLLTIFMGTVNGQVVKNLGELKNDKVYTIKSGRPGDHHLLYHTDAPNNLSSTYGSGHQMPFDKSTKNFQFAIYNYDGKYYFYNMEAGKFIGNANGNNDAIPLVAEATNDVEIRTRENQTSFIFMLSTNRKGALNVADTPNKHGVVNWADGYSQTNDAGNIFEIEAVGELTKEDQDKILAKLLPLQITTISQIVQGASSTLVGAYTEEAVVGMKTALEAYNANKNEATGKAVIDAYEAFKNSNPQTVTLSEGEVFRIKGADSSRGYLVYSNVQSNGHETHPWLAGTASQYGYPQLEDNNVYSEWAFVTYGETKFLYNVQKMEILKPSNTSNVYYEFNSSEFYNASFSIVPLTNKQYALKFGNLYLELSPGWKGENGVRQMGNTNDIGSHFYLEKVNKKVEQTLQSTMQNKLVTAWKADNTKLLGYVAGYPKTLKGQLDNVSSLDDIKNFETTNANNKVELKEGYYYIVGNGSGNAKSNWYITYDPADKVSMKALPLSGDNVTPGIPQIWKFVTCENGYKLQACNLNKYPQLAAAPKASQINDDFDYSNKFLFENKGLAKVQIKNGDGKVLRAEPADNKYAVNYWDGESVVVTWSIEPVEDLKFDVTVSSAGYATAYLPFDVELPQDQNLQAYTITNLTDAKATMTPLSDIPGHCGVILKGAAQQYSLTAKVKATSTADGNLLKGTTFDTPIEGEGYILSNPQGGTGVGLYKTKLNCNANMEHITDDSATHFKNNAYKAYLPKQGAGVRFYGFDFSEDGTTGIENIEDAFVNNNGNAVIYDLSGRRVQNTAKGGIYIVNGKKVVR